MMKSDLLPPHDGPNADPVLYGVAAGLAELFPLVMTHTDFPAEAERRADGERDRERGDRD